MIFFLYFSIFFLVVYFINNNFYLIQMLTRELKLKNPLWVLLALSLLLKYLFAFRSSFLSKILVFGFILDCALYFGICLSLYFWKDARFPYIEVFNYHLTFLIGLTLVMNSLFFMISTFIEVKKNYSVLVGFVLMTISTLLSFNVSVFIFKDRRISIKTLGI